MKRLALLVLTASALVLSDAAPGKGASEATIEGPGLEDPIVLAGEGRAGGEQLIHLAELGFFPGVFVTSPDPMLDEPPQDDLGPRYVITYVVPGPGTELDRLRQDLYPYAEPAPVTYMRPGQQYFGTERTRGGWFVATPALHEALVAAGIPGRPTPVDRDGSDRPWVVVGALASALVLLALGSVRAYLLRRRPRPA